MPPNIQSFIRPLAGGVDCSPTLDFLIEAALTVGIRCQLFSVLAKDVELTRIVSEWSPGENYLLREKRKSQLIRSRLAGANLESSHSGEEETSEKKSKPGGKNR
jgi:hypothetical protein